MSNAHSLVVINSLNRSVLSYILILTERENTKLKSYLSNEFFNITYHMVIL